MKSLALLLLLAAPAAADHRSQLAKVEKDLLEEARRREQDHPYGKPQLQLPQPPHPLAQWVEWLVAWIRAHDFR